MDSYSADKRGECVSHRVPLEHRVCSGSALYYVVAFAVFSFIAVLTFLAGEQVRALPVLRIPHDLQALLNARSGVWKALAIIADSSMTFDSGGAVNTLDTAFGNGLFGSDSTQRQRPFDRLVNAGEPSALALFATDSFGACSVAVAADPVFLTIEAHGTFRRARRSVRAQIGGRAFFGTDTVLFVDERCPTAGRIGGACIGGISQHADMQVRLAVRLNDLKALLLKLDQEFALPLADSSGKAQPLTVQTSADLAGLPEVVEGTLFIDGSMHDIRWNSGRTYRVMGDLQFTGDAILENVHFIVGGVIKVFDKTDLRSVLLVTKSELHIGDFVRFCGTAIATSKIVVYGQADIYNRSVLMVIGSTAESAAKASDKAQEIFSIFFSERCSMDGVAIALGNPGGIKTDSHSRLSGVLWSAGSTCHRGELYGVIRAKKLVGCDRKAAVVDNTAAGSKKPIAIEENVLNGTIYPLDEIDKYILPFFMGQYRIARWSER